MVPRTYPSTFAANGQQQMVVYFLTSVVGLQRWVDYIPVKLTQGGTENSYNNNGYINVAVLPSLSSQTQAWKEYIPVYQDDAATDAWQVNSIGYIPYNYAQFGDASLMLDFTNGGSIDPRVTFTRTSNATVTDSTGTLVYAPHNLLTFSESFDNAGWSKGASTTITANFTSAPNGTVTADRVQMPATAGTFLQQTIGLTAGVSYTLSVYARATSGTSAFAFTVNNVNTGGTTLNETWQRLSVTFTYSVGAAVGFDNNDAATDFLLWGAQLNVGSLQPYYPTTRKNLLGFTQEFDNAAWAKTNSSVTANTVVAPDGALTGGKLVEDTSTGGHHVSVGFAGFVSGTSYTVTVFAKASERTVLQVILTSAAFGANVIGAFDLVNGVSTGSGGTARTQSITAVGNGWYRCVLSAQATATTTANVQYRLSDTYSAASPASYTGDGTSGIFIWGAQLSDSASLDPYVYNPGAAPASTAYYGPRFDYDPVTLAPKGLLIEEQRTNLLLNTSVLGTQVVTVTAAAHTLSFYGTGTIVLSGAFVGTVTGTGAYPTRTILTFTPIVGVLTVTVTGSVTSAQLEAGAFPTSYIPTTTAAATRAADVAVMTGANFSNWYNAVEGTVFAEFDKSNNVVSGRLVTVSNGTVSNQIRITASISVNIRPDWQVLDGGAVQANITNGAQGGVGAVIKSAGAYAANNFALATNGTLGTDDTSGTVPVVSQANIGANESNTGQLNGHIRRVSYFPRRLANAELTSITS
jgi:hypothetical protein